MASNNLVTVLGVLLPLLMAGCDTMRGHSERNLRIERAVQDSLDPTKAQTLVGVSLTLPRERTWRIFDNDPFGYFTAGRRLGTYHTAGVAVSRQYPLTTEYSAPEQLQKVVDASLRNPLPRETEVEKVKTSLATGLAPYCVRYTKRAKAVDAARPAPGGLIYHQSGYGCRHPIDASIFVDISYSELGPHEKLVETEVEARANQFLRSVQLVRPNARGSEAAIVGLELQAGTDGQYVEVVSTARTYDAERQGIRPGDRIVEVDGTSTKGLSLAEVTEKLGGAAGTKTRVVASRQGESETLTFTVTRLPARWYVPW